MVVVFSGRISKIQIFGQEGNSLASLLADKTNKKPLMKRFSSGGLFSAVNSGFFTYGGAFTVPKNPLNGFGGSVELHFWKLLITRYQLLECLPQRIVALETFPDREPLGNRRFVVQILDKIFRSKFLLHTALFGYVINYLTKKPVRILHGLSIFCTFQRMSTFISPGTRFACDRAPSSVCLSPAIPDRYYLQTRYCNHIHFHSPDRE